ncbi:MAG TPA: hypothetical protein VGA78_08165 [Gemmatimonadales bacterium]
MNQSTVTASFGDALRADGPVPTDREGRMMLYGQFMGDWQAEVVDFLQGPRRTSTGEVHFAWVLEGRAIQDVWIVPARADRQPDAAASGLNWYGTTLRVYDPNSDTWRITWINPGTGDEIRLVGRRQGEEIVQEGTLENGVPVRWIFSDIAPRSCRWRCDMSPDGGTSWKLAVEAHLSRVG